MTPLVFVWPYAAVFSAVYVWAFWPEFGVILRARKGARGAQDSKSMAVIVFGSWVGLFAAFPLAYIPTFQFPPTARVAALWGGTSLIFLGSLLRRHCFRMLGQYFTGNVQTVSGQPVVDRGAYRYVRHPSYTAGIMMFLGIGVALGSWLSAAITSATAVAVYWYRVTVEERALAASLGQPYIDFMKTRKRFIPFIV